MADNVLLQWLLVLLVIIDASCWEVIVMTAETHSPSKLLLLPWVTWLNSMKKLGQLHGDSLFIIPRFILYFTTFHVCIYHVYTNLMWCYNLNYQKLLKAIWILNLYKFLSGLNVKLGRCWVEFLPTFCDVSVMKLDDDAVTGKYFARKWLKIH